jgi:tRNA threonylcarbamoyladenosine biosynthesis protein TsaB
MGAEITSETVLSIETAIQGGSLSLSVNGEEFDYWVGQMGVSKAEDVLEQISNLFERNNFKKESLSLIVVSAGPGSSTGVKIGLSLAKGLSKALGCKFIQKSVMESLLAKAGKMPGPVVTALPIGKDLICRQLFQTCNPVYTENKLQVSGLKDFIEWLAEHNFPQAVCHEKVFSDLSPAKNLIGQTYLIDAGTNLAKLIAANVTK